MKVTPLGGIPGCHRWRRFADQPISLADAVSFEVMQGRRMTRALALDRHFQVAGFTILR